MIVPEHPAIIIKRDYIDYSGLSYDEIQAHTGIDANSLKVFLEQKRYLHSLDAVRLARFFGEGDGYFVYLQAENRAAKEINGITTKKADKLSRITTFAELQLQEISRRASTPVEESPV